MLFFPLFEHPRKLSFFSPSIFSTIIFWRIPKNRPSRYIVIQFFTLYQIQVKVDKFDFSIVTYYKYGNLFQESDKRVINVE